jgi:hypothetical protein
MQAEARRLLQGAFGAGLKNASLAGTTVLPENCEIMFALIEVA